MIAANKSRNVLHPIIVNPADLKFLDKALRNEFSSITYHAVLEDGTKLEPNDLDSLLAYENPDFKRISALFVKANDNGNMVEIAVGKPKELSRSTASVFFKFFDVNRLGVIEAEIINRLKAMRPWYYWFTWFNFKWTLFLMLIAVWFFSNLWSSIQKLKGVPAIKDTPDRFTENEGIVLVLIGYGIAFLVGHILDLSREYMFPRVFFCLGRQEHQYKFRQNFAYVIFGIIGLGIVINLISKAIWP